MANKEAVFSLRVDTGNSVKDVQSFDQSINKLNKDMQDTQKTASQSTGTDNFSKKLDEMDKKLASGTLTFREMSKLMKEYQTVAAQAGSQSPVGDRAIKAAASLRDTLTDLETRTKLLSSDYIALDTAVAGIQTGTAAFQGFQSVMALTGNESEALVKTMVKLQAAQGLVNSVNQIALALNKDAILGIQLRTAAEKAYALIVGQSTGALKLLKIALASTGIGLLIVGILAAANALGLFNDGSEEAEKAQKELEKALEATNKQIEDQKALTEAVTKVIDQRTQADINAAKLAGASQEEINQITKDSAKDRLAVLEAEEKAAANLYEKKSKSGSMAEFIAAEKAMLVATEKASAARLAIKTQEANEEAERQKKAREAGEKAAAAAKKRREEEYKAEQDRLKNLQALYNEYLSNIEAAETEYYDSLLTDQQREEQAVNDKFFNLIEQAKQHGDDTSVLEAAQQKALTDIRKKFDDERLAKIAETEQKNLDLLRSYQELVLDEYQYQLIQFEDQQAEKSKKLSEALAAGIITEQQFMDAQLELEKQYAEKEKELNKAKEESITDTKIKEIDKRTEAMNNYLNASLDSLNSISDLNSLVSDLAIQTAEGDTEKQEKLRKQAFNRDKALQLGIATIQGIQAVQNAFTTGMKSPITIANPAYPYIQAALAGTISAANIAKIAASKYGGGGSVSAGGTAPSAGGASTGAGASTFTANTNAQQTDTAGLLGGQSQQGGVTQVVVVESDITNVQNKVSAQQALSTY
jgi:hypothetical protein